MSGVAMVLGMGYNFKSGNLNIPVNIGFVPGRSATRRGRYEEHTTGPDGVWNTSDDIDISIEEDVDYHSGNRFSITVGFNLSK
jgi:hypothetical protein